MNTTLLIFVVIATIAPFVIAALGQIFDAFR